MASRHSHDQRRKTGEGHPPSRWEQGSGTVTGVALVMMVGVLLVALAAGGNILLAATVARTAADHAALAGAGALERGDVAPCSTAESLASANRAQLVDCEVIGEDVRVRVAVHPTVGILPVVERSARAGPVECATD